MDVLGLLIYLAIIAVSIAAMWVMFTKAGEPGWAAIIPIYNVIVMLKIVGKPVWWIVLLLIPIVSFVIWIILALALARVFGKGGGFGVGLIFLPFIFIPILAFGAAQYVGPEAAAA